MLNAKFKLDNRLKKYWLKIWYDNLMEAKEKSKETKLLNIIVKRMNYEQLAFTTW